MMNQIVQLANVTMLSSNKTAVDDDDDDEIEIAISDGGGGDGSGSTKPAASEPDVTLISREISNNHQITTAAAAAPRSLSLQQLSTGAIATNDKLFSSCKLKTKTANQRRQTTAGGVVGLAEADNEDKAAEKFARQLATGESIGGSTPTTTTINQPEAMITSAAQNTMASDHLGASLAAAAADASRFPNNSYKDCDHEQTCATATIASNQPTKTSADNASTHMVVETAHSITGPKVDTSAQNKPPIELRFLVRRREAGALIGKRGANIKRLREMFKQSTFSIPDTGNGPERVVCVVADSCESLDSILQDFARLFLEKSPENDEQIELKLLIHSSHAGSLIGVAGQSIKKLRNDTKAAIKIYELCCPLSSERVCGIKAKPLVVVGAIKLIRTLLSQNPIKGTYKPYDALNFDVHLADKYGGYLPDDFTQTSTCLDHVQIPNGQFISSQAPPNDELHHRHYSSNHSSLYHPQTSHQIMLAHQHHQHHHHHQTALPSPTMHLVGNGISFRLIRPNCPINNSGRQKQYNNATVWSASSVRSTRSIRNFTAPMNNNNRHYRQQLQQQQYQQATTMVNSNNLPRFQRFHPYNTTTTPAFNNQQMSHQMRQQAISHYTNHLNETHPRQHHHQANGAPSTPLVSNGSTNNACCLVGDQAANQTLYGYQMASLIGQPNSVIEVASSISDLALRRLNQPGLLLPHHHQLAQTHPFTPNGTTRASSLYMHPMALNGSGGSGISSGTSSGGVCSSILVGATTPTTES